MLAVVIAALLVESNPEKIGGSVSNGLLYGCNALAKVAIKPTGSWSIATPHYTRGW